MATRDYIINYGASFGAKKIYRILFQQAQYLRENDERQSKASQLERKILGQKRVPRNMEYYHLENIRLLLKMHPPQL